MQQIYRFFRNLKMNQQVTLFVIFIMAIVLILILGTCMIQAQILFTAIQSSSQVIATKQEKRSIGQTAIRVQEYLERKYHQGKYFIDIAIYNIHHVDKFVETTFKNSQLFNIIIDQFYSCQALLENKQKFNNEYDSFCYQSLYNQDGITLPNIQQINNFKQTMNMLSQYSQVFDLQYNSQLLIFDLPNPKMRISYPQNYQLNNYSIETRPWYLSISYRFTYYQNQYNPDFLYSPVFLSAITNDLIMMVIKTICDDEGTSIGLTAQTLSLNDNNIETIPINIILVNDDGEVILTSIDSIRDAKEQIQIYNTAYTGFNQTDWKLIINHSNSVDQPLYYCSGFQKTFCLYNKYFNKDVQIDALRFQQENFTLVVFVNVTFSTQLEQQYTQLTSTLSSQIAQIQWILIITCSCMITITFIMISIIFLPLFQLMKNIKLHIKTLGNNLDKQIFTMSRQVMKQSNIFSKLTLKFLTIQDSVDKNQSQKSDLCLKIERFQYNKKHSQYDLAQIKSIISDFNQNGASISCIDFYEVLNLNQLYKINL